jgi:hypothetical protein
MEVVLEASVICTNDVVLGVLTWFWTQIPPRCHFGSVAVASREVIKSRRFTMLPSPPLPFVTLLAPGLGTDARHGGAAGLRHVGTAAMHGVAAGRTPSRRQP